MTWQLMWRNIRIATLKTTFQLLVIYRYRLDKSVFDHFGCWWLMGTRVEIESI